MDRRSAFVLRPTPRRRAGFGALACLGLLALGGCAGGGTPQAVNSAALAQRAYAANGTIHSVSEALDQRLDRLLAVQVAGLQR